MSTEPTLQEQVVAMEKLLSLWETTGNGQYVGEVLRMLREDSIVGADPSAIHVEYVKELP